MKKFVKGLFCFLGAFVLGVGIAILPFINTFSSYASSPTINTTYENFSPVGNDWERIYWNEYYPDSVYINATGNNVYSINGSYYYTYNQVTYLFVDYYGSWSWVPYTWTVDGSYNLVGGSQVVAVGSDYYYIGNYSSNYFTYKYNSVSNSWVTVTWSSSDGFDDFDGSKVWTDGTNYYYSSTSRQYILDFNNMTATRFTWTGSNTSLNGNNIWTDGVNYYYSNGTNQCILDTVNYTTTTVLWNGYSPSNGSAIWTDGVNIYCPYNSTVNTLVLDVATRTWSFYYFYNDTLAPVSLNGLYIWHYNDYIIYMYQGSGVYRSLLGVYSRSYQDGYNVGYNAGYNAGVSSGSSDTSYQDGYNAGYNAGISSNSGYTSGYNAGYNAGYSIGYSEGSTDGYNSGYSEGNREGYNTGYNEGVEDSNEYTFLGLVGAVIDAPIQAFTNLFNFEIFGTNIKNLLLALFTASIIVVVVKFALGGK